MVDFGRFDAVLRLALLHPHYQQLEATHLGTISKMGVLEDISLIFGVGVAMVVPLVPIPWSNEPFWGDFDPIFHVRLYLDHNKHCGSKIWRLVQGWVERENRGPI